MLTIKMSAVMAQFRKSSVSPMKMQTWIEKDEISPSDVLKTSSHFPPTWHDARGGGWSYFSCVRIQCWKKKVLWLQWLKNMLLCHGPILCGRTGLHFGPIQLSVHHKLKISTGWKQLFIPVKIFNVENILAHEFMSYSRMGGVETQLPK